MRRLGTTLPGANDALAVDEAVTSLDVARRDSITNNSALFDLRPSILTKESLIPSSAYLYSTKVPEEQFKPNCVNIGKLNDARVFGGCIVETPRTRFAAAIIFSPNSNALVMFAPNVELAVLESEYHDDAHAKECWERHVLREDGPEFMACRVEAERTTRTAGIKDTPSEFVFEKDVNVTRYGIHPWMSARLVNNEQELQMVTATIAEVLRILPPCSSNLSSIVEDAKAMLLCTVLQSGKVKPDIDGADSSKGRREAASALAGRPVITASAMIILQAVTDDTRDEHGNPMAEFEFGVRRHPDNIAIMRRIQEEERSVMHHNARAKGTDLSKGKERIFNFQDAMEGLGRDFDTQLIVECNPEHPEAVLEAVARDLFPEEDVPVVVAACKDSVKGLSLRSTVATMAKCLDDRQVIAVITRERDGRVSNASWHGSKLKNDCISMNSFQTLVLRPWATLLMISDSSVFKILTKEPESTPEHLRLHREKLRINGRAGGQSALNKEVFERLAGAERSLGDVSAEVRMLKSNVKDLTRKIDIVLERAVTQEDRGEPALNAVDRGLVDGMKRVSEALAAFAAKRARFQ